MALTGQILIVDDEHSIRFFLKEILTRDGHQVVTVESGEAALQIIEEQEFDLALIDLNLGSMTGIDVLTALRKQSPDTVPIVLTAHASLETSVDALRQGAHDYLFKPCKTVELRESVRRGLLKRDHELQQRHLFGQIQDLASALKTMQEKPDSELPALSPDTQAAGNALSPASANAALEESGRFLQKSGLVVDFLRHVITLDDNLLELSPTEFNLLAYLISEAPRVVPPQELVREVQGYESEQWEASETVRQHVHRIRQKIKEASGRTDIIRTVRGVGYTIDE
ncbi:MAG: response regulator transcription factor [Anaerolineae bacterium]|nr:response regulator transcription factor [Anaerolineae bacterium]